MKFKGEIDISGQISKYRAPIMGLAIVWVLLYHFGLNIPVLSYICGSGFMGVDLFMFLSGFGLFFSMRKSGSTLSFYGRRLLKVFPLYILFGIVISFGIQPESFSNFLLKTSTVGFWTGGDRLSYEWFIPSIIVLYLIFPFVVKLIDKYGAICNTAIIVVSFIFAAVDAFCPHIIPFPYFLLAYRIPEFFLGLAVARSAGTRLGSSRVLIVAAAGLILSVCADIWAPGDNLKLYYFGRSFAIPAVLVTLCLIFKAFSPLASMFSFIGVMTMEIYLVHFCVLKADPSFLQGMSPLLSSGIKLFLSVGVGVFVYYFFSRPLNRLASANRGTNKI